MDFLSQLNPDRPVTAAEDLGPAAVRAGPRRHGLPVALNPERPVIVSETHDRI